MVAYVIVLAFLVSAAFGIAKLFGLVATAWWIVLAPFELVAIVVLALAVYLLITKENPFQ